MHSRILIDTSVLIAFDRDNSKSLQELIKLKFTQSAELYISPLTEYEYFIGVPKSKKAQERSLLRFKELERVSLSGNIGQLAASLSQKYGTDAFDALLAATAITENLQLATLNQKHFKIIKELKLWGK
ncbi:MAG: PIN domain-containing protein [Patescibacteria group bacterium]